MPKQELILQNFSAGKHHYQNNLYLQLLPIVLLVYRQCLKLKTTGSVEVIEDEDELTDSNYAESVLWGASLKKRRRISDSKYRSTNHVSPTTNIVERANSQAKPTITDRRNRMLPETLNMLMTLMHNKSLWPNEKRIGLRRLSRPRAGARQRKRGGLLVIIVNLNQTIVFLFEIGGRRNMNRMHAT